MSKCPCGFCHLHVHSEYSLLDGGNRVKDIAKRAADIDMPAVALTDHGVMYGAIDHYTACKDQGVKGIIGCCIAGQLIYTDCGVKPIEEIEVGDMVLTHQGRFRPVVRTMTRHYKGPLFGVRAANSNVVWLTDEHPVLVSDRKQQKLEWVRADELEARAGRAAAGRRGATNWKSYALFPRLRHEKMRLNSAVSILAALDPEHYGERDGKILKKKSYGKYDREILSDLPVEMAVTPQFADFLGLFVAEGSFQRDPKGRATAAVWSFGLARDRALAQQVVDFLRDELGLECDWRERPGKALLEVLCRSTILARALESWCGSGAHRKRVPAFVFGWDDACIAAFLQGLADGDGKIDAQTGRVNLKMVARDVVYGARLLLARLGMTGKAAPFEHAGHKAYLLTWSPNAAYRRHGTCDKYLHLPLKEIQGRQHDGPVFNIEVADDHSYVTDIVLHNCEAYVAPRKHTDKDSQLDSQKLTNHLTLWAKNLTGYKNLVKMTTKANLHGFYYKPRVDHELLAEHSEGLAVGSACLGGEIPQLIIGQKFEEAVRRAEKYREIFGKENFFLELMDHDLHGQDEVNQKIIDIHHKTGIPLVATNDAHYNKPGDDQMHKILVCIGTNTTLEKPAFDYGPNFYMKTADEMWDKFKHVPEAIENTMRIAEMCNLELDLKTTHFPHFDVPHGHTLESYFRHLCEIRFPLRYPKGHAREAEAKQRMAYEQEIIVQKGYPGYFLVVQDFINWSKERGILVGCRGSAAGCLVSYVLGITNLDPLPFGLLFERFLNPDRVSTPDIDVDFPDKRRDEVMRYVQGKYGKEKVAHIITFGTLAARAAVKDTGRVKGLDPKLVDTIAKLIPAIPSHPITIKKALDEVKELRDQYETNSQVRDLLDSARGIEGLTRHASRHACGVVIGKDALDELVPLEEKDGVIMTQYHSKAVEKVGLVKMDFLGLQNNTVINDTLELIQERRGGERIDLETIALDDKSVYDSLGKGDGIAVFQMEGVGMRKLLREMKPENLEHIIAQISLYRPGPMDEIPRYIKGRFGGAVTYPHAKLVPVLKDTYGMLLYQEQVMQAAQVLAGFTGGQAETLMKAMSKKKADDMAKMKPLFLDGCKNNRIGKADAEDIFDKMEAFARYAFNKSHAAYYGLVSYWTAWLKTNYAPEFMACKMTSLLEKKDKLLVVIDDCRRRGLQVLAPDINESNHEFTVVGARENENIRFGLKAIKGIGDGPVNAICEARKEGGKFVSLFDFCERVSARSVNKSALEVLVKCGAFDSVHANRQALLDSVPGAMDAGAKAQADALSGQNNLFALETTAIGRPKAFGQMSEVADASREQRLMWEKEFLGLYISDHPLLPLRNFLDLRCTGLDKLGEEGARNNDSVEVGGMVTALTERFDKNSRKWAIATLEDLTGTTEVLVFAKTYAKCGSVLAEDAKILVRGRVSADQRRGGFGGGGGDDEGSESDTVYKIMADDIELIPVEQVSEEVPAEEIQEPPSDAATAPEIAAPPAAPNGSYANGANGNGHANGANGNGVVKGSGISITRTNANNANSASALPPPASTYGGSNGGDYGQEFGDEIAQIGRFFEPPEWAAQCVHLHIDEACATATTIGRLWNICKKHHGDTEVWLHIDNGVEMMQLRVASDYWVELTPEFEDELRTVLSDGCYHLPF